MYDIGCLYSITIFNALRNGCDFTGDFYYLGLYHDNIHHIFVSKNTGVSLLVNDVCFKILKKR